MDNKSLKQIYKGSEILEIWNSSQNISLIKHPEFGDISPYGYRAKHGGKRCPFCAKKMFFGPRHKTRSKDEAVLRGYEYIGHDGKPTINKAGRGKDTTYFHQNYVTLDHKINKARCPELMFDHKNLQVICWACNREKGDNNFFELEYNFDYIDDLASETLKRYCPDKLDI